MTNTPPTTAGTAWNIDYEAHGLAAHANIDPDPRVHRGELHTGARARVSLARPAVPRCCAVAFGV